MGMREERELMEARKSAARVLVVVEGGLVQTVLSDTPDVRCDVLDHDSWKAGAGEEMEKHYAEVAAKIARGEADGTLWHIW